ncbi:hypothetical protein ES319_A07G198400v1 [Gossypium barbadense]|uniref:Uncharacterized protein n=2 Tax=Gossypium TaxID=3633 RepID=A0A5J5V5N4_GOSBA|nr:hypothetical protein ES319_A07G198400v1 [Gossypium barbadense]TYH10920.1 hypothetical protein ES288_A07G216500v1 [Gossypium darwinii]
MISPTIPKSLLRWKPSPEVMDSGRVVLLLYAVVVFWTHAVDDLHSFYIDWSSSLHLFFIIFLNGDIRHFMFLSSYFKLTLFSFSEVKET